MPGRWHDAQGYGRPVRGLCSQENQELRLSCRCRKSAWATARSSCLPRRPPPAERDGRGRCCRTPPRWASYQTEVASPSGWFARRDELAVDESPAGAGAVFIDLHQHPRFLRARLRNAERAGTRDSCERVLGRHPCPPSECSRPATGPFPTAAVPMPGRHGAAVRSICQAGPRTPPDRRWNAEPRHQRCGPRESGHR